MATPTPEDLAAGVPQGANIVSRRPAPSGKGELLLDANGGVYDTGGQSFGGSYFSLKPEQRQGTRQFTDLQVNDQTGGYKLISDQPGQEYNFDPSEYVRNMPKANPLYSDPAFLQFVANAGMTYETAAADVTKRKAALQNALALDVPELEKKSENNLKSIYGDFASRGLYGAGQQGVEEGEERARSLGEVGRKQGDTANQINELTTNLAYTRQGILQDAAQKGLSTAGTQDLDQKFKDVDRKYPAAASGAY